jgi:hypothetical protein
MVIVIMLFIIAPCIIMLSVVILNVMTISIKCRVTPILFQIYLLAFYNKAKENFFPSVTRLGKIFAIWATFWKPKIWQNLGQLFTWVFFCYIFTKMSSFETWLVVGNLRTKNLFLSNVLGSLIQLWCRFLIDNSLCF